MGGLKAFTEETFREWVERDERRKDLEREARQLKTENDLITDDLFQSLKAADKTTVVRGKYRGELTKRSGTVSWKQEFIRSAGAVKADALAKAAPPVEGASIVRVPD